MKNDKLIIQKITEIGDSCKYFLAYTKVMNQCAHTDRVIEQIIGLSKQLDAIYEENFEEEN